MLATGGGPFARLFQDFDAWDPRPAARFGRVLEYLQRLAQAPRALVIHGNYLDDEETRFLAEHAATMSVVYCPRTHHFFRHEGYPLADMLRAGVSMALGTDSRGSNPDLDMLTEMRFAAAQNPDVNPATILELGTLGGARALGWADRAGTLEAGKSADLAVVQITSEKAGDPHELIFALSTRVAQTWARGRVLYDAAK